MAIDLFGFQAEDVEYLHKQHMVLIANDMGTGKTYEAIARDQRIRMNTKAGNPTVLERTLVIAPLTTLESTWQTHFEELTNLPVTLVNPKDRAGSWAQFKKRGGVFCVHWEALRLMPELNSVRWLHIIADECHRAKNRSAQQTQALKKIQQVSWKTAMSGTPVINRPDELWSMLNWLYPDRYRSYWKFFNKYVEFEMIIQGNRRFRKIIGPINTEQLLAEIKLFYVRRRKEDVLPDLPAKYYSTITVDLSSTQRRAYDMMKKDMIAWIGQQEEELLVAPVVIAQLTRLQQFACAHADFDPLTGRVRLQEPSSKLDALMQILEDNPEQQVVVFSRFKSFVHMAMRRLQKEGITHVELTGDIKQEDRSGLIRRFQSGAARVFVGSIAAGGVGITLTAASTVVFVDRDWSPALNAQAEDRLHRIGQKDAVQVIDIIARNTVDLGRMQRLELKKAWIRQILGDPTP
jgi:SNF2 family DNA or RNA helicase